MHARLRCSKSLLLITKLEIKPDFPSLADEIAEPHPDMNIKVAAFTVSDKSSNTFQRGDAKTIRWQAFIGIISS